MNAGTERTILYIDDDFALATLARKALGRKQFEIVHCAEPDLAVELVQSGRFEAIILDHYMNGMTGVDFLDKTADMDRPPIIYVTGSEETSIAVEALKSGASDYIIKSVGDEFWSLLANVLEQAIENDRLKRAKIQAEQEILAAKERAEILLTEVNHRVANSLALVASLIRLQISTEPSQAVKDALAETQARINAVAGMHRSLYTSDDVRHVDMEIYLKRLVDELSGSMGEPSGFAAIALDLEPLRLPSDKAVAVGVIVTELVTNAIKYAYAGREPGRIAVALHKTAGDRAKIIVEDDGCGIDANAKPQGTGLGTRVVRAMAVTLGSGVSKTDKPAGTRFEVDLAL